MIDVYQTGRGHTLVCVSCAYYNSISVAEASDLPGRIVAQSAE